MSATLIVHADWSMDAKKRWMTVARPAGGGWQVAAPEPVGDLATLPDRLAARAGGAVALGVDFPIGLPRGYVRRHVQAADFPAFLAGLRDRPGFFDVCATLDQLGPDRPFYPARGVKGMTRAAHAAALGLEGPQGLSRLCDRATAERPAGAPLFWTLGANQTGKAAITAWRDLLLPNLDRLALWPFAGPLAALLARHRLVLAETYPAEALRHLGLRLAGSKRRQADRAALGPALLAALRAMAGADAALVEAMADGFGADAAGEDRFDSVLGCLCVLAVASCRRADHVPDDPWLSRWEGWVLGSRPYLNRAPPPAPAPSSAPSPVPRSASPRPPAPPDAGCCR
jgi:hypothetical protein